jgi:hypothetical protein
MPNDLHRIYAKITSGFFSVSIRLPGSKTMSVFKTYSVADHACMSNDMGKLASTHDVYFNWNVLKAPSTGGRGRANETIAAPGVFLDVDIKQGDISIHANDSKLPKSLGEVMNLLDKSGLPKPTEVISSGNGFYFRYLFDIPVVFGSDGERDEFKLQSTKFYKLYAEAFKKQGWVLDNVSDLARITRMEGTLNHKTNPPKPVERIHTHDGPTLSAQTFAAMTGQSIMSAPVSTNMAKVQDPLEEKYKALEATKASSKAVVAACKWFQSLAGRFENLSYPEWMIIAGLLKHCEDGEVQYHSLSSRDPRYDRQETATLWEGIEGPMTCDYIQSSTATKVCDTCPAKWNSAVKTPIAFGWPSPEFTETLTTYVYANQRQLFFEVESGRPKSKANMNDFFARYYKAPAQTLIADKRLLQVDDTDYLPGVNERFPTAMGRQYFNIWIPSELMQVEQHPQILLEHFQYLIPNDDERNHVLDVLANAVQKPGQKIKHCVLLTGGQGTGKSFLNNLLDALFGQSNVAKADNDTLISKYNACLGNKQILILEEVGLADRLETYNRMKVMITEEQMMVEEKHEPRYETRTPRLILAYSNKELPIKIEAGDRRFMFVQTPAKPQSHEYYNRLFTDGIREAGGFLNYLFTRNISAFSASAAPPETEIKRLIIHESKPSILRELEMMILDDETPFNHELFTLKDVQDALVGKLPRMSNSSHAEVAKRLRQLGYEKVVAGQIRLYNGKQARLWTHGGSGLIDATAEDLREIWKKIEYSC